LNSDTSLSKPFVFREESLLDNELRKLGFIVKSHFFNVFSVTSLILELADLSLRNEHMSSFFRSFLLDSERGFFKQSIKMTLLLLWLDFVTVIDEVEALSFETSSVIVFMHDFKKSRCKFSFIIDIDDVADKIVFSTLELAMKAEACLNIFNF